jgi:predicted nucleic acid-binding protein
VQRIIVDTGPIVALLNRRDGAHAKAMAFFDDFDGVAFTTWAVLTESWHLLPAHHHDRLLTWLEQGGVRIAHVAEEDLARIRELVARYRDRPMALADATLVWLADRERLTDIVTLDSGFSINRTASGTRFTNHIG